MTRLTFHVPLLRKHADHSLQVVHGGLLGFGLLCAGSCMLTMPACQDCSKRTRLMSLPNKVMRICCRRKQKENQEDLLKRVNEETLRQLRHNQDDNNQAGSGGGRQVSEVVAYRSISEIPPTQNLAIQVCCLRLAQKSA